MVFEYVYAGLEGTGHAFDVTSTFASQDFVFVSSLPPSHCSTLCVSSPRRHPGSSVQFAGIYPSTRDGFTLCIAS